MSINFKQPKYILPLILLPFLCLFFFVYRSNFAKKEKPAAKQVAGLNATVGEVAPAVRKKQLDDKLDAYRDHWKEGDGLTAVSAVPTEKSSNAAYANDYTARQKRMLDSINQAMKKRYVDRQKSDQPKSNDYAMAEALNNLNKRRVEAPAPAKDPMSTFKMQMAFLDSMNKANDPAVKAEKQKAAAAEKAAKLKEAEIRLPVKKVDGTSADFNTVQPNIHTDFIKVVIDENLTGYAGSRIRLRLLDDIQVGNSKVPKDTYLYALISGFSGQRVTLSVKSILYDGKILPVKLDIYDMDGLLGLYVPESAFRDFTKDASTNVMQGVDVQSASGSFLVSAAGKIFESTSSAIAGMIRKNKARIKYNSYLYLIDNEALQSAQKSY
ncbi:MAG: conjugative transposon protein TraM [Bacteroidetes bacterium]|nr:conjugative transposon protein TraM [Bacteroidota bacterium]